MSDGKDIYLDSDQRSLLRSCGGNAAEDALIRMRKELRALREPISSPNNPSFHNLHRSSAQVLSESRRVRTKALKSMAEKQKKFQKERKRETAQELHEELCRIKAFPEQVGSKRSKTYLMQMRRNIASKNLKLEMEEHKLNEGRLSEAIRIERDKEVVQGEKRRTARRKEEKWANRKSHDPAKTVQSLSLAEGS